MILINLGYFQSLNAKNIQIKLEHNVEEEGARKWQHGL